MGTWSTGTLDNDLAQDFLCQPLELEEYLEDATEEERAKIFFDDVMSELDLNEEGRDKTFYDSILISCEIIAAAFDKPSHELSVGQIREIKKIKPFLKKEDLVMARNLVEKILKEQELYEVWENHQKTLQWVKSINGLKDRLS